MKDICIDFISLLLVLYPFFFYLLTNSFLFLKLKIRILQIFVNFRGITLKTLIWLLNNLIALYLWKSAFSHQLALLWALGYDVIISISSLLTFFIYALCLRDYILLWLSIFSFLQFSFIYVINLIINIRILQVFKIELIFFRLNFCHLNIWKKFGWKNIRIKDFWVIFRAVLILILKIGFLRF